MVSSHQAALAAATTTAVIVYLTWLKPGSKRGSRLPGPPGRLVVGNLADLPQPGDSDCAVYGALCDKYGSMIQLDVPGKTFIILDNAEDAKQLFWTRSSNYSNRMSIPMVHLIGWGNGTGSMQLGDDFRNRRRLMNKMLGPSSLHSVADIQERAVRYFVRRVASGKVCLNAGIKYMSGSIIVQSTYGYTPNEHDDKFVDISEKSLGFYLDSHDPSWLVNIFPLARFIPSWFPGAGWKRTVDEWRKIGEMAKDMPFAWARQQIEAGTAVPSFIRRFLTDPDDAVDPELLNNTVSALYAAGAGTTASVVQQIFVALALHPEIQARAQAEVDSVIQGERLPNIEDRSRLPYVEAVFHEIVRWRSITHLGLPHVAINDDEYKGYHIPSGSILIANIWRMLHDPKKYPEPDKFNPDRFLKHGNGAEDSRSMQPAMTNEEPWHYIYGFGLRQCPGRQLADATIWLSLAHVLATVNVRDLVHEDGSPVAVETFQFQGPSPGLFRLAETTSCTIEFRSAKAEALLAADAEAAAS